MAIAATVQASILHPFPSITKAIVPEWAPKPSAWVPQCHPKANEVSDEVNGYFLKHWPFPNVKAEAKFLKAGFSLVTSMYFPLAKDDRLHHACKLLTILFLIDDLLEDMSFADGESYNARLIAIARGEQEHDEAVPVEYMWHDMWESMCAQDRELAEGIKSPTFDFMRAQTDRVRAEVSQLGQYLQYREKDVGQALLAALMRFTMELRITSEELELVSQVEKNCARHVSVVNDIYSWEKELQKSKDTPEEGAILCSAVKVVADETRMTIPAAKRVLWSMLREWEPIHEELCKEIINSPRGCSLELQAYLKGLEYQMSGNELWSRTTPRYAEV